MRAALRTRASLFVLAVVTILTACLIAVGLPAPATATVPAAKPAPAAAPVAVTDQAVAAAVQAAVRARAASSLRLEALARHAQIVRVQQIRTEIVSVARKQLGDRYSAGSSGPNAFDCSGLTRYVYKVVTGKELPHYSGAQYARVTKVSRSKARPGDLVFFLRGGAHHVGIYIGKGRMIDAAGYGEGVRVSPISGSWWSRTFTGIGRLLPA